MTDPKKLCDELEFRMKRGSITATDGLLYDIVTALRVGSPPAPDNAKTDWFAGDVDCDGEPLTTIPTHEYNRLVTDCEKFRDQVRDTCARAEKAEAALLPAPDNAALAEDDPWRKFDHWFFKECNVGTRRHLFAHFGLPVDEITDHSRERIALKYISRILTAREREQAWQAELRGAKLVEELADIIETLVVAYGPNASPSRADTAHAIIPIITRECDAAAKAALEAAAKCASDYLNGATFDSRDCGIICPERIRALDPAQFRKDR